MKMSEELTLDLKPEAKQRIQKLLDEKINHLMKIRIIKID